MNKKNSAKIDKKNKTEQQENLNRKENIQLFQEKKYEKKFEKR